MSKKLISYFLSVVSIVFMFTHSINAEGMSGKCGNRLSYN